jgi:hypothetical protein
MKKVTNPALVMLFKMPKRYQDQTEHDIQNPWHLEDAKSYAKQLAASESPILSDKMQEQ